MSLSDLKPCPFCGCDGWIVEDRGDHSCEPLLYRPQCKMCGGGLGGFQYRDNAIMVWNTRAEGVAALQQTGEPEMRQRFTIGQPVEVPDTCQYFSDWRGQALWVAGVQFDRRKRRLDYTVSEHWPPRHNGDLTDGWDGEDLSPLPQQTALVEQGVEKIIGQHEPAACGASAPSSDAEPPCPKRGEIRVIDGRRMRFIERELEGDKWEIL